MNLVFAYIDPGSGSLLLQAAIAALLSVPFIFRNAVRQALGALRKKPTIESPHDTSDPRT